MTASDAPPTAHPRRRLVLAGSALLSLGALGCAGPASAPSTGPSSDAGGARRTPRSAVPRDAPMPPLAADGALLLDRITWGVSPSSLRRLAEQGEARFLAGQLRPARTTVLPDEVVVRIAALTISQRPMNELVQELERQRRAADALADDAAKTAARQAYQQTMTRLAREAASRSLLLALHSPDQLRERMTWFWTNHFSVFQGKANLRAMVGDYEDRAIRPHALGRFRDLLGAATRHPAMLRYLDNERNAAGRLNENHARELLELHTLGVDGGYTQADVQELARVLTGVGVNFGDTPPRLRPALQATYVRDGGFEFNPARHDFGDKRVLGRPIAGRGLAELDEVLDLLARHPSTATHVCRRLARFLVADAPDPALVARLASVFSRSDGDIAAVLESLVADPAFRASLGTKFKDPMHYVVSAVRLAYDDRPVVDATPMLGWIARLGEPPFGRQTPDGYPLDEAAWSGSGQMTARFEIARAIGSGTPALFRAEGGAPVGASAERPPPPALANVVWDRSTRDRVAPATRRALEQAASPQEWNAFLLSSPEFMRR
ncbi:MAG: DUF1800 domain-containing protein [Burkholderiales bacterium]|nr:MAG: DUF1800 domain-containing protein [Burkholderiales bacterium]